ncbi:hypothetical protein HDV63DRAFT_324442 [Trichoderma sp. SZMC 28014]
MAVASTNRSLLCACFNINPAALPAHRCMRPLIKDPPSQRHLKRVKRSEGVCLWLPCAPIFADLANQSGHLHRNCHDCSPYKSGTMCAAMTHCVCARLQVEGSISAAGEFVRGLTSNVREQYYVTARQPLDDSLGNQDHLVSVWSWPTIRQPNYCDARD